MNPENRMIPYGHQALDETDIQAVVATLRSAWLTCGPAVECFERALAAYSGAKHAIVVSNGTAALHVAMLAAGIHAGQRVLTSTNTFLASANCAEYVGAQVDFADIDPATLNLDPQALAQAWTADTKAVVCVDFAGRPCEMPAIHRLAKAHGAWVIEDAAHALGSVFEVAGRRYRVGGHPWADMTTFSFHPVKTITTGEGGAILTDNETLARRCRRFRSHGMIKEPAHFVGLSDETQATGLGSQPFEYGPWYYEMQELGYNYRLTDFQCALGLSQLKKLDQFVARRTEIVAAYNAAFAGLPHVAIPLTAPAESQVSDFRSQVSSSVVAWHLYVLQIDFAALGKTRTTIMNELRQRGVGTQVHYIPVHLQPYYRNKYGYALGKCPVAESCYQRCLSLPLYPAMTDNDVERVIQAVREVIQVLGRRSQVSQ